MMKRRSLRMALLLPAGLAVLLGAGAVTTRAAAAPPDMAVAVVTDLAGGAQLRRSGQVRALAVLDGLQPHDQLQLAAGSVAELAFTAGTGSVLRLSGPGRFRVRAADVLSHDPGARVERRDLAAAWRGLRIRPGLVGRASIALRGFAETQVTLRAPLGGQDGAGLERLDWDRPYGNPAGAWDYTVRVIDDQGSLVFVAQVQERSLRLPADLQFDRGHDYLWTVQAQAPDRRPAYGAAEFHRVAEDAEARVQEMLRGVGALRRDPAQPESTAEEVLLALALEQAGMHAAAQRQWRALQVLRPALATLPRPVP